MSFTVRVRGAIGSPITAEYRCPVHGVFEAEVRRDIHGDPPDDVLCPADDPDAGWKYGALRGAATRCNQISPWTLTRAPAGTVRMVEAVRGKSDPAPTPFAMDTRDLGEGMPPSEWKRRRAKMWNDVDYRAHKEER